MLRLAITTFLLVAPALPQKPGELKTEGDTVSFTLGDDGVPMVDFVKWAQALTGRTFTYDAEALAAAEPVKQIGTVSLSRAGFQREFLQFFAARLFVAGFALQANEDTGVTSIVGLPRRAVDVRFVPVADLEEHAAGEAPILTSIPLETIAPGAAIERLNKVMAATEREVLLQALAGSLLVQGAGTDVWCVSRMIRILDGMPAETVEVIALEHRVAADLAEGLRGLIANYKPAVVIVAHGAANALMISGGAAVVAELRNVVGLLDRAAKK